MIICNNQQKRYNIIKLTELLHANDQSVGNFFVYNHKEEYLIGQVRCFSFWFSSQTWGFKSGGSELPEQK